MKKIYITIIILFAIVTDGVSLTSWEEIDKKNKSSQDTIIKNSMARQKQILAIYDNFFKKFAGIIPGFESVPPIEAEKVIDIKKNDHTSKIKKVRAKYAYLTDTYRTRKSPADSNRDYISKIKYNSKVKIIDQFRSPESSGNITKEWILIEYKKNEGYIPGNLINKKRISNRYSSIYDYLIPEKNRLEVSTGLTYDEYLNTDITSENDTVFVYDDYSLNLVYQDEDEITSAEDLFLIENENSGFKSNMDLLAYNFFNPIKTEHLYQRSVKKMSVNVNDSLNVRKSPSARSKKVGVLYKDDVVDLIKYSSNSDSYGGITAKWGYISCRGIKGWVFSGFLKKLELSSTHNPADLKPGKRFYVKSDILKIREEPEKRGCVIVTILHKSRVEIIQVNDKLEKFDKVKSKWVKISYKKFTGWVFGGFLGKKKNEFIKRPSSKKITKGKYVFPVDSYKLISSKFGYRASPFNRRKKQFHGGIDIAARRGTPIKATAEGKIIVNKFNRGGYGWYCMLQHRDGNYSLYGHQTKRSIARMHKNVDAGDVIGYVGSTGASTGPHLHFEIRTSRGRKGKIDPFKLIHGKKGRRK